MGYGILLAGYLCLLSIPLHSMGIATEIVGYILIVRALTLLSEYQEEYRRARLVAILLIPMGAFSFFLQGLRQLGKTELFETINRITELPYAVLLAGLLLWFHHHLLRATEIQAHEVDLPKLARLAVKNRILTFFYFALVILQSFLNIPTVTRILPYTVIVSIISLVGIIWLLSNAWMIFTCYVRICLPEDLDMPMHKSKLPNPFAKNEIEVLDDAERKRREHEAYDAEMRAKQTAKTKKNKRKKH